VLGFAEGADDGEAVGSGEHAVEDDGRGVFLVCEKVSESGVAVGLVVGAVTLGLEIEEETLGEMFFVFDEDDERSGGLGHAVFSVQSRRLFITEIVTYYQVE
jgi:hypothetical protein